MYMDMYLANACTPHLHLRYGSFCCSLSQASRPWVRLSGGMSNNGLTYTDSVICYKELIDKEDTARRLWKDKYGKKFGPQSTWRPVEPFEAMGASDSKMELPSGIPVSAIRNPPLYRDTVGNEGLAGGTPLRFGGQWDVVSQKITPWQDPNKPPRVNKKGPHDCYCDVG